MKKPNLIASAAAILFTCASLSAVNYNVPVHSTAPDAHRVIDLAPVNVYPSAAELRATALLPRVNTPGVANELVTSGDEEQFRLIGSQLAMPYYSFGNKFGRISKE